MRPEILFPLFAEVTSLKGVGARVAPLIRRLAGPLVRDVLFLAPSGVVQRRKADAATARDGETVILDVTIDRHFAPHKIGAPWKVRAFDGAGFVHLIWFKGHGEHFQRLAPPGARRVVSGKVERFNNEAQIAHPEYVLAPERADEIPGFEAVYPATHNLSSRQVRKLVQNALPSAPDLPEWQDAAWLARQRWPGWHDAILSLHDPRTEADVSPDAPPRLRLAYDELLAHQLALGQRRQARLTVPAPRIAGGDLSDRLQAALPFTLTGAQTMTLAEIRGDLASGEQMGRLLQGDVGSGKTAVAALAMADAAGAGFQAALMAPTEILARQHAQRLVPLFDTVGVKVVLLTGRDPAPVRRRALEALASGEAAIAIGTHALFQDAVRFDRLALAVVDEQHRFGVKERARLQAKGDGVHLLTMSATPIPRTLELTQYGDLEVSRLREKPPGRTPVTTAALPQARIGEVVARLGKAITAGAQAYWICPLVAESEASDLAAAEERAGDLRRALKVETGLVHGQMPGAEREPVMAAFAAGELPLLVATTVVEVGVDVPAATIMVIEHAERFGLAQLHQLRGRVGRGAATSACILLYGDLGETAKARLETLRRTDDGFEIAEEDFRLRGGGDPLGLKQSGFPAYRFADPIRHRELLLAAADDARLVMRQGPDGPRAAAIHILTELFDWKAERPSAD